MDEDTSKPVLYVWTVVEERPPNIVIRYNILWIFFLGASTHNPEAAVALHPCNRCMCILVSHSCGLARDAFAVNPVVWHAGPRSI